MGLQEFTMSYTTKPATLNEREQREPTAERFYELMSEHRGGDALRFYWELPLREQLRVQIEKPRLLKAAKFSSM